MTSAPTPPPCPELRGTFESNIFFKGDFAPVTKEHINVPVRSSPAAPTSNIIPSDLDGVYARNGSNSSHKPRGPRMHWFEGDGMIHRIDLRKQNQSTTTMDGKEDQKKKENKNDDGDDDDSSSQLQQQQQKSTMPTYSNRFVQTGTLAFNKEWAAANGGTRAQWSVFNELRGKAALAHFLFWKVTTSAFGAVGLGGAAKWALGSPPFGWYGAKDVANTGVAHHNGHTYALVETGPGTEIKLSDLSTVGVQTFNGSQGPWPLSPHYKICPITREFINLGYRADCAPFVAISVMPESEQARAGKLCLRHVSLPDLEKPPMLHDYAVSRNHVVVICHNVVFDRKNIIRDKPIYAFDSSVNARIAVVKRSQLHAAVTVEEYARNNYASTELDSPPPVSDVKWFDISNCAVFHVGGCFESADGKRIVLTLCRHPFLNMDLEMHNLEMQHLGKHVGGNLCRYTLDLESGAVEELSLAPLLGEFPVINNNYCGLPNRYVWMGVHSFDGKSAAADGKPIDVDNITNQFRVVGLAKYDLGAAPEAVLDKTKKKLLKQLSPRGGDTAAAAAVITHEFRLAEDEEGDEFVFAPRTGADPSKRTEQAEDDGYLVGYVYSKKRDTSDFVVLDAATLKLVTRLELPQRVPHGFHGMYWASEMLGENV